MKKFSGPLAQPMQPFIIDVFRQQIGAQQDKAWIKERGDLIFLKKAMILEHYGIREGNYAEKMTALADALLQDFVPGFQVANPFVTSGRPTIWTPFRLSFLRLELKQHMLKKKCNVHSAATALSRIQPWKTLCDRTYASDNPAEVLRKRYYSAAKRKDVNLMSAEIIKALEAEGTKPTGEYDHALKHLAEDPLPPPHI